MPDRPLRIGVDARELEGKKTGVGRYLINLLREWSEIAPENRYVLFFMKGIPNDPVLERECISKRLITLPRILNRNLIWEQVYLPVHVAREETNLFFSPSYTMPFFVRTRTVVTVHDISYEVNRKWFPPREAMIRRFFTRLSTNRADAIITISEFSKRDIIKYFGINGDRIKVIYPAADSIFSSVPNRDETERIKKRYNTGERFLLYVGSILNRRPVNILIKSFSKAVKDESRLKLVIVGENRTWPKQDMRRMISDSGVKNSVIYLDYIPDDELALLYKSAEVFIYPSLYEGFGLPLLEAMSSGTPVIAPNVASFPEVVGDGGILIDRIDEDEMSRAILAFIKDESMRNNYIIKGKERARKFSWRRSAEEHLELFRDVVGGSCAKEGLKNAGHKQGEG